MEAIQHRITTMPTETTMDKMYMFGQRDSIILVRELLLAELEHREGHAKVA
jgi:hypothetical protein